VKRGDLQWKLKREGDVFQKVYEEQIQRLTGNRVCREVKYSLTFILESLRGDYSYLRFGFGDSA
jgi:hypothetical protein